MKRFSFLLSLLIAVSLNNFAGEDLNLNDLCRGVYSAQRIYGVTPMLDGESYSQLSPDRKQILQYSFKTGEQTGVIFDVNNTKGRLSISSIDGYIMSPTEAHILLKTETKSIYRHSQTAVYYIYNVKNRTLAPLSDGGPQEVPLWSRDGNMVAFVRDNNLFLVKLLFDNAESQITKDGKFNEIISFLAGIGDTSTLEGLFQDVARQLAQKQPAGDYATNERVDELEAKVGRYCSPRFESDALVFPAESTAYFDDDELILTQ